MTVNPQLKLKVDQCPLPRIDGIFASLGGGNHFSKIDLRSAKLQMEMDYESKMLLTLNTHKGPYQPYRVESANFSRRRIGHAHGNSTDSENVAGVREPNVHAYFIFILKTVRNGQRATVV